MLREPRSSKSKTRGLTNHGIIRGAQDLDNIVVRAVENLHISTLRNFRVQQAAPAPAGSCLTAARLEVAEESFACGLGRTGGQENGRYKCPSKGHRALACRTKVSRGRV